MCVFFFCKQKTAYEVRISDWSSDVCSSDLSAPSRIASSSRLPSSRSEPIKDSITKPLSTATPQSAMNPTAADIDKGIPRAQSASTPPVNANGIPAKTIKPSLPLPNMAQTSAKTPKRAHGNRSAEHQSALQSQTH